MVWRLQLFSSKNMFFTLLICGLAFLLTTVLYSATPPAKEEIPQATLVFTKSIEKDMELINNAVTLNNAEAVVVVTEKPAGDDYRKRWENYSKPVFFVDRVTFDNEGAMRTFLMDNFINKYFQNYIFVIDINIGTGGSGAKNDSKGNGSDWEIKTNSKELGLAFRSLWETGKIGTICDSVGFKAIKKYIQKNKGLIDYTVAISPEANNDELEELSKYLQPNGLLVLYSQDDYYRHIGGKEDGQGEPTQNNANLDYKIIVVKSTTEASSSSLQAGTLNSLNNYSISSYNITGTDLKEAAMPASLYLKGIVGHVISGDPTFIQPNPSKAEKRHSLELVNGLIAQISVPMDHSLVRGKVPIFGLAYGKDFKEFRVEYCEGIKGTDWVLIKKSSDLKEKDTTPRDLDDSADITIHGNLATWDTGLKSYVYLPDFPPDHPVDLNGIYTLRLVVTNNRGEDVEDRIVVEVGEAIPNAWGGIVRSKDKKVTLSIPEQSLMSSFRLISIKQADTKSLSLPEGKKPLSGIYEFREMGEKFTKGASLEFELSREVLINNAEGRACIYGYDVIKKKWTRIQSRIDTEKSKISAEVKILQPIYAVFTEQGVSEAALPSEKKQASDVDITETSSFYLVKDAFEKDAGGWSNRDGSVGAQLSRDNKATYDDTYCLKISAPEGEGNFACNIYEKAFDARTYPRVKFDYRIPPDVKIDFYIKVKNKWYEIGFTGAPSDFKNKRVNVTNIGRIRDVVADDKWHTAEFDLLEMLRTRTQNTTISEFIMANWEVTGFMKLSFGTNKKGAHFYIDNFTISKNQSQPMDKSDELVIDDFNQMNNFDALGGRKDFFVDELGSMVQSLYVKRGDDKGKKGYSLKLSYFLKKEGGFAGYIIPLQKVSFSDYGILSFYISGEMGDEKLRVGLKDASGNECKVNVNDFLRKGIGTGWTKVTIPLVAFGDIKDWDRMASLSFSAEAGQKQTELTVYIDHVKVEKRPPSVFIDDFQNYEDRNLLGGKSWVFLNESAAIHGAYKNSDNKNKYYSISYGGNLADLFTYCGWTTQLKGLDVSGCSAVRLRIKGADGNEEPTIYLYDGNDRWGVKISSIKPLTTSWQEFTIPLIEFSKYGVDLTHLDELQLVFEWNRMSGTVSIDDIEFIGESHE